MGKNRLLSGIQVALDQIDTFTLPRYYPLTSASNFNAIERPANLSFRGTIKFAFRYMKKEKQLDCVAIQVNSLTVISRVSEIFADKIWKIDFVLKIAI